MNRVAVLLSCLLVLGLAACEKKTTEKKPESKQPVAAAQADQAGAPTEAAETAPAEAPKEDEAATDEPAAPAGEAAAGEAPAGEHAGAHALPASLDNLFPPKAEGPAFLMAMHGMASPFEGMMSDLMQGDPEGAKANLAAFKEAYTNTSKLVPEWTEHFPAAPVEALGVAFETGDQGQIMGAVAGVGQVCSSCHHKNMVPVQAKYHWPSFANIKVSDPLRGAEVDFRTFMQTVGVSFMGIANDLKQGQPENAKKGYEGFQAAFKVMKDTCDQCHDSERAYFVDASIETAIADLGKAIESGDAAAVEGASMKIGMESCFKCHLVHLPAAFLQANMAGGH